MATNGWIGVDLDGTLAEYTPGHGPQRIGAPVPAMVERVQRWLAEGRDVRIFTARIAHQVGTAQHTQAYDEILAWCRVHIGRSLRITCTKDADMDELWDDRVVTVERNTGRQLSPSTRGLE